jgi:hypothetical protein
MTLEYALEIALEALAFEREALEALEPPMKGPQVDRYRLLGKVETFLERLVHGS